MDIRSTQAARLYEGTRGAMQAETGRDTPDAQRTPGRYAAEAAADFATTLRNAEETARDAMVGKADPHALVQALSQTELAIEAAVTVRDKVVEAYQEILRMPV